MANCPVCSRQDRTAKVSSVVRDGTSTTRVTGSSTFRGRDGGSWARGVETAGWARHAFTSHSQSTLAARLSFPSPPKAPPRGALWAGIVLLVFSAPVAFVFGIFGLLPAVITGAVLRLLLGKDWRTTLAVSTVVLLVVGAVVAGIGSLMDGVDQLFAYVLSLGMWALLGVAGVTLVLWYFRASAALSERDGLLRSRAWQAWQRLYFCFRDDVVFDPATGAHGPSGALRSVIGYPGGGT